MIQLNEQEVQNLINFANDIPTKYGMPLIQFINSKLPQPEQPINDDLTEIDD